MDVTDTTEQLASVPRSPRYPFASTADGQTPAESVKDIIVPEVVLAAKIEEPDEIVPMSEAEIPPSTEVKMPNPPESPPPGPPPSRPPRIAQEEEGQKVPNYKTTLILSGHTRSISSVKFNPEGTILASAGEQSIQAGASVVN